MKAIRGFVVVFIIAAGILLSVCAGQGNDEQEKIKLERRAWVQQCLTDFKSIKTGMTRVEVETKLRVDGGPTRNNFLMQFQADILRCRLARTNIEEVSALGVALMAGLSVGLWQDLDQIQTLRRVDKEFSFMMNIQTVQKNCEGWEEAVSSVLTSNRILQQDNELKIEVSNEFQKKADIRPYRRYTKHL